MANKQGHHVEMQMGTGLELRELSERFHTHDGKLEIDGHRMTVLDNVSTEIQRDGTVFVTMTVVATSGKIIGPAQPGITWGDQGKGGAA